MAARTTFYDEIAQNKRKSILLAALVFITIVGIGYAIGLAYDPGFAGVILIISGVISLAYVWYTYYNCDKIVIKATGARPATKREHAHLVHLVEGLSLAAGVPTPKIYVIDSDQLNAMATGRDPKHAVVIVTRGLLNSLNRQELEGVIAHEMSHVANYDILFATLLASMVGVISIVAGMLRRSFWFGGRRSRKGGSGIVMVVIILFAIFAPILSRMVQLAASRKREFLADATGAKLTRYPKGLASALRKIKGHNHTPMKVDGSTAHLFFVNPFASKALTGMFSTHPPIDKRIKILESM